MTDYDTLVIERVDAVHIKVRCERSTAMELHEHFTFMVPNARFHPLVKEKVWDGKIRLFNLGSQTIYGGLATAVEEFASERDYNIEYKNPVETISFDLHDATQFCVDLAAKGGLTMQPRDYQLSAFSHAVRNERCVLLSPTASGKSFIIYLISMYYQKKTLIIVPTTSLVHQLYSDFQDYGLDAAKYCHKVFVGQDKDSDRPITITTWQSIYNIKDKKWFQKYDVVIGDEAHLFKATSLTKIMTNLTNADYRFGFTGTLDGSQTHQLVLEGLFGPVHKVTTTAELIEQKHLANFKIKAIVLDYPDELRKWASKNLKLYKDEIQYVVENNARNEFIKRLCLSLKGNTLVLYQFVEKQGKPLYKKISDSSKDRKVFFVHGGVEGKERDDIRYVVEQEQDAIIVASYGTFSTGVNIKNIHNIVFASPFKSKVKNLQSIGRGLRKGNTKDQAVLYDIVDDISWKSRKNHVLNHFHERVEIYDSEKFDYKIYTVKLGA